MLITLLAITFVERAQCAEKPESGPNFAKLASFPPQTDLVSAAQVRNIPLSGTDPEEGAGVLNPGDSFTAVVTLFQKGGKRSQWLLYLLAARNPTNKITWTTNLYGFTTNKYPFASSKAPARLQMLGPFTADSKSSSVKERSSDLSLDQGMLGFGLDRAAAMMLQASQSGEQSSNAWKTLLDNREFERDIVGGIQALISYFEVVRQTDGLDDILMKVIRKPSVWSVIRHVGIRANVALDEKHLALAKPGDWGLQPGAQIYLLPNTVEINDQLALKVTFAVTSPHPPLLSCGGIVGMLAEKPDDPETYLVLRVVSARRGKN